MLVTAYSDMEAAIAAVNSGAIYKYVTKPWDPAQFEQTLKQALEFFMVQDERDQLLREKMSVLRNMMIADRIVSLGLLAAGLSHHIRNSLVAVKTFLELAPRKMAEEKAMTTACAIRISGANIIRTSRARLKKSTICSAICGRLRKTNPVDHSPMRSSCQPAVENCLSLLREPLADRRIEVENQIPASLPALHVDKPKFYRLFDLVAQG